MVTTVNCISFPIPKAYNMYFFQPYGFPSKEKKIQLK